MAKTKWIIEPSRLTIYPKRALRWTGLIFFILIGGVSFYLFKSLHYNSNSLDYPLFAFLILVPLFIALLGESNLVFDGSDRKLYRKLSFLTFASIPFDDIAAVEPYQVLGSGFNYRLFKKSNRHGKGIIVSSGYNKATSPNLLDFEREVLPKIDELVFANAPVKAKQAINDFEFYRNVAGVYTLKEHRIGRIIVGLILIGITVAILLNPGFMANETTFARILITYFPLVIGIAFIVIFFSSVSLDQNSRKIIYSSLAGRIKREYAFDDFIRFQIIRKTMNFIYAGTEVKIQLITKNDKVKEVLLKNFRSTKKIDRFLDETNTILGLV